jgi:hypothetical protein
MFDQIIERSHDEITERRHSGDFSPNFTQTELNIDTNDFGMSPEEWAVYSKRVNESIANSKRIEQLMADRADQQNALLLPPTAQELQDLFDSIAKNHGYDGAQAVINCAWGERHAEQIEKAIAA